MCPYRSRPDETHDLGTCNRPERRRHCSFEHPCLISTRPLTGPGTHSNRGSVAVSVFPASKLENREPRKEGESRKVGDGGKERNLPVTEKLTEEFPCGACSAYRKEFPRYPFSGDIHSTPQSGQSSIIDAAGALKFQHPCELGLLFGANGSRLYRHHLPLLIALSLPLASFQEFLACPHPSVIPVNPPTASQAQAPNPPALRTQP